MSLAAMTANSVWTTKSQARTCVPFVREKLAPCSAGLGVMRMGAPGSCLSTTGQCLIERLELEQREAELSDGRRPSLIASSELLDQATPEFFLKNCSCIFFIHICN